MGKAKGLDFPMGTRSGSRVCPPHAFIPAHNQRPCSQTGLMQLTQLLCLLVCCCRDQTAE